MLKFCKNALFALHIASVYDIIQVVKAAWRGKLRKNITARKLRQEEIMDDPSKRRGNFVKGRFLQAVTPVAVKRAHFTLNVVLLKL